MREVCMDGSVAGEAPQRLKRIDNKPYTLRRLLSAAAMSPISTVLESAVVQSAKAVPAIGGIPRVTIDASQMSDANVEQRCWRETLSAKHQLS